MNKKILLILCISLPLLSSNNRNSVQQPALSLYTKISNYLWNKFVDEPRSRARNSRRSQWRQQLDEMAGKSLEHEQDWQKQAQNKYNLLIAANKNDIDTTRKLLYYGADKTSDVVSAVISKAMTANNRVILKALFNGGVDINKGNAHSIFPPLIESVVNKKLDITKFLLESGANPNITTTDDGRTALHRARDTETIQVLLQYGADINARDTLLGDTPLLESIVVEQPHITKFLLESGANPQIKDKGDRTALHKARDIKTIQLLLGCGIDVNAKDYLGLTPLYHNACSSFEVIKTFIDHGAHLSVQNNKGNSLLHCAAYCHDAVLYKDPISFGNCFSKGSNVKALFYFAWRQGELTRLLMMRNNENQTPVDVAREMEKIRKFNGGFSQFLEDLKDEKPKALNALINEFTQDERESLKNTLASQSKNISSILMWRQITGKNPLR